MFGGTQVLAGSDFASTGVANAKACDSHRRGSLWQGRLKWRKVGPSSEMWRRLPMKVVALPFDSTKSKFYHRYDWQTYLFGYGYLHQYL